ncbi:tyrosine-type recombinase/integrase [Sinorhizobium meliloti]|uniref:tyrosine-type recombinase/integrase n=1 Tax=Rhizobium meliloti TaxID=382 RepID=UPI001F28C378|nr:tyrosine-type recombinase/integrase [Sinorhizobium meliloti]
MNATDYLKRSALYRKLVYGPYREFARVYGAEMSNQGLGRRCTWRSLSLFRDLMDWHVGNGHAPQDLSEVYVDRFLEHRFKYWSPDTGDRSALRRLLSALREEDLIPAALPVERTEHEQIVKVFARYLSNERGLAASTVGSHKLLSLRFLREVCPAGADGFAALTPEIVIGYVERHALDGSADSGKAMCGVVRAFLRYLHLKGFISTALADCVPSIRRWRLASLPTFLPPEKVQRVLDACDRTTAMGHRDYAVLMILAKLGLRASEVATLNLDDIDWQSGAILVHGKGTAASDYAAASRRRNSDRGLYPAWAPSLGMSASFLANTCAARGLCLRTAGAAACHDNRCPFRLCRPTRCTPWYAAQSLFLRRRTGRQIAASIRAPRVLATIPANRITAGGESRWPTDS